MFFKSYAKVDTFLKYGKICKTFCNHSSFIFVEVMYKCIFMKVFVGFLMLILFSVATVNGQQKVNSAAFSDMLNSMLQFTVPVVSVRDAKSMQDVVFLDARERKEYDVSHIPGAIYIGYESLDEKAIKQIEKGQKIVIYCSVGYRSEKIGEKLQSRGFNRVYNLYGSIFEWVNQGYALEDRPGHETQKIHVYDKQWGKWMTNGKYEKVY